MLFADSTSAAPRFPVQQPTWWRCDQPESCFTQLSLIDWTVRNHESRPRGARGELQKEPTKQRPPCEWKVVFYFRVWSRGSERRFLLVEIICLFLLAARQWFMWWQMQCVKTQCAPGHRHQTLHQILQETSHRLEWQDDSKWCKCCITDAGAEKGHEVSSYTAVSIKLYCRKCILQHVTLRQKHLGIIMK